MANFKFDMADTDVYAVLKAPEAEDKLRICMAGAQVLLNRLREFLDTHTNDRNEQIRGALARSLVAEPGIESVFVLPKGKHHGKSARRTRAQGYHRAKTGQGRGIKNAGKHHGMTSGVSARDVGYFLEYGTPRMSPLHWMETTLEQCEGEVQDAMEQAWDEHLKDLGL